LCLLIWFNKKLFCRYECGYGLKDYREDPNHMGLIKCSCLAHFSIKRLYTWSNVMEITFYHWTHTWANGDPIHTACWLVVHITNVSICFTHVLQIERFYMDPIRVRVHRETNLWQAQGNLVGKGECRWVDDMIWLAKIPIYGLLELEAEKGHLVLA